MPVPQPAPALKKSTPWPMAEEEKLRLYNDAQNAARRVQSGGLADEPAAGSSDAYGGSSASWAPGASGSPEPKSTGAQMYQHAMANVNRNTSAQASYPMAAGRPPSSGGSGPARAGGSSGSVNRYPSAEEEKAASRYYEAKRAVDRAQNQAPRASSPTSVEAEEPIACGALYPSGPSQAHAWIFFGSSCSLFCRLFRQ